MIELSVLIPVWRSRPIELLHALAQQARALQLSLEIWVCDDSADPAYYEWHSLFSGHPSIRILTFSENLGRSRARNTLLAQANGLWVLWLDGDLEIPPDFLKPYQEIIGRIGREPSELGPLYCGGIRVDPNAGFPDGDKKDGGWLVGRLRHRYALQVEGAPAAVRQRAPYRWVRAAHCLMPARAARSLSFPEYLQGYGHEDTHWAFQIQSKGMSVHHLDHPVEHKGIDTDEVFVEKSRQAIRNLAVLWRYDPLFARYGLSIPLIRVHDFLQSFGVMFFLVFCSSWFEGRLLKPGSVSLRLFGMMKLIWFDRALRSAQPFQKPLKAD
jgi:glycosyltransferase involved in cell wall biosynthesis